VLCGGGGGEVGISAAPSSSTPSGLGCVAAPMLAVRRGYRQRTHGRGTTGHHAMCARSTHVRGQRFPEGAQEPAPPVLQHWLIPTAQTCVPQLWKDGKRR
jgi:hypothetical protein